MPFSAESPPASLHLIIPFTTKPSIFKFLSIDLINILHESHRQSLWQMKIPTIAVNIPSSNEVRSQRLRTSFEPRDASMLLENARAERIERLPSLSPLPGSSDHDRAFAGEYYPFDDSADFWYQYSNAGEDGYWSCDSPAITPASTVDSDDNKVLIKGRTLHSNLIRVHNIAEKSKIHWQGEISVYAALGK